MIRVLDHYYVELKTKHLGVVVGNIHSRDFIIGYIKYTPTNKPTQWQKNGVYYERLVKKYTPATVREHTTWRIYSSFHGSEIPIIPVDVIERVYEPTTRAQSILSNPGDKLEKLARDFILEIQGNLGILPGVTGSLLPGIHNVEYSDLDFVVYGEKESLAVVEYISENQSVFQGFKDTKLEEWSKQVALTTGLTRRDALKFYRNWRRGIYKGREYSVIYNNGVYQELTPRPAYKTLGEVTTIIELKGSVRGLNYPLSSRVESYRIVESNYSIPYDITEVLSYEALYTPGFLEGGVFEVHGLLQCSSDIGECRVVVGVYEVQTYMRYYH